MYNFVLLPKQSLFQHFMFFMTEQESWSHIVDTILQFPPFPHLFGGGD